ncbi:MAG TPA: hypothetical protein VK550_14555 [Polyangiaceae bacterium]|nr:hypothetical protein [Polyangiaceae bacterium]
MSAMANAQPRPIVAELALRAEHYDAFRAWCQRCWSGVAHGCDLKQATLVDTAADSLLSAAEASEWIRRRSWKPRPEQLLNARIGVSRKKAARHAREGSAAGIPVERPEHFVWEPARESPSYCEFLAFIQLERCVFVPLTERWRQYAIAAEQAEGRADHHVAVSSHAKWERDRAEKLKAQAKRRARLMAKGRRAAERAIRQGVGPAVNACAAALPLVASTVVSAQLRYSIKNAEAWTGIVPQSKPEWDIGDVE